MYDFLGTFNKSQFERFLAFAKSQLPLVEERVAHLKAEKGRIGRLTFIMDEDNVPSSVTADPSDSYIGKLLAAYEVLGGNPFLDLRTRTKAQALYVVKGPQETGAQVMSNGEVLGKRGHQDAYSAELIRKIRNPLQTTMSYRFERLERKIRRALDYTDQLDDEIIELQVTHAAATIEGSLAEVSAQVQDLFGDRNYRAIYDDANSDPLGKNVHAPMASYDVEPSNDPAVPTTRIIQQPQRQGSGFVAPGESGGATS